MTRTTLKTLMASLLAATIGSAALMSPANAGGSVSLHLQPKNAKQEQAMRAGLTIYAIVNAVQGGSIKQKGNNNAAGLAQFGQGNLGVVHQEGNNHTGTLTQKGNNNACGLFQFGQGTNADVAQHGNGETCATVTYGW